jgi:hypothetical protein
MNMVKKLPQEILHHLHPEGWSHATVSRPSSGNGFDF